MNCSYKTVHTKNYWDGTLQEAYHEHCSMWECCDTNKCQDSTCIVTSIADHFINAVDNFLEEGYEENCQRYVTTVTCSTPPFNGHLFINRNACNGLKHGRRPTKDNILSTCEVGCQDICENQGDNNGQECEYKCKCQDIYCKLEPWSLMTTTATPTLKHATTMETFTTTVDTTTTVQQESTTPKPATTSTTATQPLHTYPPDHATSSSAKRFTEQALSTNNKDDTSAVAIGGGVGGVIILLLIVAVLLMIFIRRRSSRQEKTRNSTQNHNGAFFNSAFNQTEVNMNSTSAHFNTDSVIVPNGRVHCQEHFSDINEHEYANTKVPDRQQTYTNIQVNGKSTPSFLENSDYKFAKLEGSNDNSFELEIESNENSDERVKSQQNSLNKGQFLSVENADNTDDYELLKPRQGNNDGNYCKLEPQSQEECDNPSDNYFVLEKENQRNGPDVINDVYNTLNEDLKTNDQNKDEYHHLRDISRSGREEANYVEEDSDDYDMLKKGDKSKEGLFNDDYDHCKPIKNSNGEDDYDHFT